MAYYANGEPRTYADISEAPIGDAAARHPTDALTISSG